MSGNCGTPITEQLTAAEVKVEIGASEAANLSVPVNVKISVAQVPIEPELVLEVPPTKIKLEVPGSNISTDQLPAAKSAPLRVVTVNVSPDGTIKLLPVGSTTSVVISQVFDEKLPPIAVHPAEFKTMVLVA